MELKCFDSATGIGIYSDGKQMYISEDRGKTFVDIHAKVFPDYGDFEFEALLWGYSEEKKSQELLDSITFD